MLPLQPPTAYSAAQHSSTEEATSTSAAVVWPATAFTVPTLCRVVASTQSALSMSTGTPAPAVATDIMLIANLPEFVLLPAGMKLGVLAATTAGVVCFTPCT